MNAPFTQSGGAATPATLGSFAAAAADTTTTKKMTRRLRRDRTALVLFRLSRVVQTAFSTTDTGVSRTRKNGAPITATAPPTKATRSTNRAARFPSPSPSPSPPPPSSTETGTNVAYICWNTALLSPRYAFRTPATAALSSGKYRMHAKSAAVSKSELPLEETNTTNDAYGKEADFCPSSENGPRLTSTPYTPKNPQVCATAPTRSVTEGPNRSKSAPPGKPKYAPASFTVPRSATFFSLPPNTFRRSSEYAPKL